MPDRLKTDTTDYQNSRYKGDAEFASAKQLVYFETCSFNSCGEQSLVHCCFLTAQGVSCFPSFNWGGPERLVTSVVLTLLTYPNYIDFIIKHQKQEHNAAKTTTTTRRIRIVLLTEHCFHQGKQLIHVSAKCSCSSCVPYSGLQSRRIDSFFVSAPVSCVDWRLRS